MHSASAAALQPVCNNILDRSLNTASPAEQENTCEPPVAALDEGICDDVCNEEVSGAPLSLMRHA